MDYIHRVGRRVIGVNGVHQIALETISLKKMTRIPNKSKLLEFNNLLGKDKICHVTFSNIETFFVTKKKFKGFKNFKVHQNLLIDNFNCL